MTHHPVLLTEALEALAPREGEWYLDATFGAGGYSRALLNIPGTKVLALDRDPEAQRRLEEETVFKDPTRFSFYSACFGDLLSLAHQHHWPLLDGLVFDIGVSSFQLETSQRGFSFRLEGPLDMRMDPRQGRPACDLINQESEETLALILYRYGEERASRRIARALVRERARTPFTTTRQLAEVIERVLPSKPHALHPATRSFQALRIAVNDELGELIRGLRAAETLLKPGGRLVVVTFHSLEDRIVKHFLLSRASESSHGSRLLPGEPLPLPPSFLLIHRKSILPQSAEIDLNPRARSAKLRWAQRTDAAPHPFDPLWQKSYVLSL